MCAIAREEVAAGDGALRTCKVRFPMSVLPLSNIKSSTNLPSLSKAWALTPAGPLQANNMSLKLVKTENFLTIVLLIDNYD